MKRLEIFLLIVILALNITSHSQSFVHQIATDEDEFAYTGFELPSGGYILYLTKGEYTFLDRGRICQRDILLKLDIGGNFMDSLVFLDTDTLKFKILDYSLNKMNSLSGAKIMIQPTCSTRYLFD
jgi:hypothetical protein